MIRSQVLICGGTGCTSSGSAVLMTAFEEELQKNGLTEEVKIVKTGCFGLCALGPVVIYRTGQERVVYLNDATADAINRYLLVRKNEPAIDKSALFLSNRKTRISREAVHSMVKKSLLRAGLDASKYSAHNKYPFL